MTRSSSTRPIFLVSFALAMARFQRASARNGLCGYFLISDSARAAAWLEKHTPPESALYVWDFEPTLYTMAHRRAASRYVYNVPQRLDWRHRAGARRQLLDDLKGDPPAAIVVVAHDAREGVTGNLLDSRAELDGFPGLRRLLERDYVPAWRLEDLTILSRR